MEITGASAWRSRITWGRSRLISHQPPAVKHIQQKARLPVGRPQSSLAPAVHPTEEASPVQRIANQLATNNQKQINTINFFLPLLVWWQHRSHPLLADLHADQRQLLSGSEPSSTTSCLIQYDQHIKYIFFARSCVTLRAEVRTPQYTDSIRMRQQTVMFLFWFVSWGSTHGVTALRYNRIPRFFSELESRHLGDNIEDYGGDFTLTKSSRCTLHLPSPNPRSIGVVSKVTRFKANYNAHQRALE